MGEPSDGAVELWASLSREDQLRIARDVAARRSAEFRRTLPNVVAVGAGLKTEREFERPTETVCLRFMVRDGSKWDREDEGKKGREAGAGRRRRAGSVPRAVVAYEEIGGQRRAVAIPTDVAELPSGREQRADAQGRVRAVGPGGAATICRGSIACVVREPGVPGVHYALGCHHVFTRSTKNPSAPCGPMSPSSLEWNDDLAAIGTLFDWTTLMPGGHHFGLDAALVRIARAGDVPNTFGGIGITGYWDGVDLPPAFRVFTPREHEPRVLEGFFVSEIFSVPLKYRCRRTSKVRVAIEYLAPTEPGDSGSPLIADDGTLVGMHFYGTDRGTALAIPAYELLGGQVFSIPIELV